MKPLSFSQINADQNKFCGYQRDGGAIYSVQLNVKFSNKSVNDGAESE